MWIPTAMHGVNPGRVSNSDHYFTRVPSLDLHCLVKVDTFLECILLFLLYIDLIALHTCSLKVLTVLWMDMTLRSHGCKLDQAQFKLTPRQFRRQAESNLNISVEMICSAIVAPSQSYLNKSVADHS